MTIRVPLRQKLPPVPAPSNPGPAVLGGAVTGAIGTLLLSVVAATAVAGAEARTTSAGEQRSRASAIQRLERVVRQRVDSKRSTGIAAGIVFPDGRTHVVAYGDAGTGKRLDSSSVFEIGSITKTFTGTLLADMVQRGEVQLSDPVAGLLPAGVSVPSRGGREITLEDLATHTSGLPRMPTNHRPDDAANPYADYTVEQLYAHIAGWPAASPPAPTSRRWPGPVACVRRSRTC